MPCLPVLAHSWHNGGLVVRHYHADRVAVSTTYSIPRSGRRRPRVSLETAAPQKGGESHGPDSRAADDSGTAFEWLLDPANLTVSPWFRKAAWLKDSSGPGAGATRELKGFGSGVHEQLTAYDAPRSCSYRVVGSFPATKQNGTHLHAVGRRHSRRMVKHLHAFGTRRWQGGRGTHRSSNARACLPRDPRWLREGTGELAAGATASRSRSGCRGRDRTRCRP